MKIKTERFWTPELKELIKDINEYFKRMEIEPIHGKLKTLFTMLKESEDSKTRVSLCFVLEQVAHYDPFFAEIVEFLMELLKDAKDEHVKEFAVYILGNLVLEKPNLSLITQTLPVFIEFCKDSSDHVRVCAEEMKDRLAKVKETKEKEQEVIDSLLNSLTDFTNQKITEMNDRASEISKQALNLDYEAAFFNQEEMVKRIHEFSDTNQEAEEAIRKFIKEQVNDNPVFEGEFKEAFQYWKDVRAEKEDLIRQVHCIIRIQGKIFKIIEYIKNRGEEGSISIEDLKQQTKGGMKGEWSDTEIIDTLEKLVEEEIIPNLFLQQVKDLKGLMKKSTKKS